MSSFPFLLATAEGTGSIMIIGFLLVVTVLALLAAATSAIGAFFAREAAREAARAANASRAAPVTTGTAAIPTAATAAPAAAAQELNPEDDPLLLAVIAAAVHSIAGDRAHRVVSIRSSAEGWAQEGRRQIFSSHRVR